MAISRKAKEQDAEIRRYFVDEGGDSTLFSSNGKVIIETPGCSRFFMLGLLDVSNPVALQNAFDELRDKIVNDPYFSNVPSIWSSSRKTATAFHAKDDLPEVRKEVFTALRNREDLRFFAVVTDKMRVLTYVRQQNDLNHGYHYNPNELYDYLIRRLFKNRLHKDSGYKIVISKRGKSDRTVALRQAIEAARKRFAAQWDIRSEAPVELLSGTPAQHAGLQAVDYFTWALQRLFEKGEDRYISYLWPAFRLVEDMDDNREAGYGTYYTQKKPLNAAALKWRTIK